MDKTRFEQLSNSQRILANTLAFLQEGTFTGKACELLAECQKFTAQLHKQTTDELKEAFNEKFETKTTTDTASAA